MKLARIVFIMAISSNLFAEEAKISNILPNIRDVPQSENVELPRGLFTKSYKYLNTGDYWNHFFEFLKIYKKGTYSKSFELQSNIASSLSDLLHQYEKDDRDIAEKFVDDLFEKLEKDAKNQPPLVRQTFFNELYYRNSRFLDQYNLGKKSIEEAHKSQDSDLYFAGLYSIIVGGAHTAFEMAKKGKEGFEKFAWHSIGACKEHEVGTPYFNIYEHSEIAHALLGDRDGQREALLKRSLTLGESFLNSKYAKYKMNRFNLIQEMLKNNFPSKYN